MFMALVSASCGTLLESIQELGVTLPVTAGQPSPVGRQATLVILHRALRATWEVLHVGSTGHNRSLLGEF